MNNEQQEIKEEWKDIVIEKNGIVYNYTGIYQVSNMGRVKRLKAYHKSNGEQEHIMKSRIDAHGYEIIVLSKDGIKTGFKVHRLVATAFIPNTENLPVVNHKDECKTNNVWTNLEWCTVQYNVQYSLNIHYNERSEKVRKFFKQWWKDEENRGKMKIARNGKYNIKPMPYEENPKAKKVVCLNTGKIFGCIKRAYEWCGSGHIAENCNLTKKYACKHPETGEKLYWMWYSEYVTATDDEILKRMEYTNEKARKVICLETQEVFNSIAEAKKWVGTGNVKANVHKKAKSAGKHPETGELLHWMYYDEWLEEQKHLWDMKECGDN